MIAFTGHRNGKVSNDTLAKILKNYPDATWVHGGAVGFDSQVMRFATDNNIKQIIIKPDYKKNGRGAPFVRNRAIVDMCAVLIACYDGRDSGGTFYTINYAKKCNKHITTHEPHT